MFQKFINSILHILNITPDRGDIVSRYETKFRSSERNLQVFYDRIESNLLKQGRTLKDISFPRLPNISKFKIQLNIYNPLLLAYGILGKYKPIITMNPYRNSHCKRYYVYMQQRLSQNLQNPKVYWTISRKMIMKSNVYLLVCLQDIDRNWYRKLEWSKLKQIIKKVDQIRGRHSNIMSNELEFTRVYVPKVWGSDLWRGLGVPSKA